MKKAVSRQVLALILIVMTIMLPVNVALALEPGSNETVQGPDMVAPQINATIPRFANSNAISISGSTEKSSALRLFVNDMDAPARVLDSNELSSGIFEFLNVRLQKENVIKIRATDPAGNTNETIYSVSVDTEKPEIVFDSIPLSTSRKNLTIVGTVNEPVTMRLFLADGKQQSPKKVLGLKANASGNSVVLEWNESKDKDFSHYIIYRKDIGPIAIAEPASYDTYTDILVNSGHEYSYQVSAVSKFGKESELSSAESVRVMGNATGRSNPVPVDTSIAEKPDAEFEVNSTFSESLRLGKDGEYTLLIKVADRAKNTLTIEKAITLDTKRPDIKITNPPPGAFIYENYAGEVDISGTTEPNAKVHLFIERTPFGSMNKSFSITAIENSLDSDPKLDLDAKCSLKAGGTQFCASGADLSTNADSGGIFKFENIDVTTKGGSLIDIGAGFDVREVAPRELSEEIKPETTKTARLLFIAEDSVGLKGAKDYNIRIGTCWSGNQSFDLIPLSEFQSPTLLSPERLAENKETIYFFFNYSYIGRGSNAKIESVSIQRACSGTELLGEKRFNTSCMIMPPGGFSTSVNPEGAITYTALKLNRLENMDKFLEKDWKAFFGSVSNEMTFPLKVTIRYKHTVDGREIRETQTTCQEITYVMDNSIIDPRAILPDFLLYDFVDFLEKSIETTNKINQQLNKVLEFVTIGCVSTFFLRSAFQVYRRFISFSEEKMFQLKDISGHLIGSSGLVKFNVQNDQDQEYCNSIANNIKKEYKLGTGTNVLFGLKLKYFSDSDLKRCFPNIASAWETEANLYKYYRYTCDRVFGHQTPSRWTENLEDDELYQKLLQGSQCANDQTPFGRPITPVKCRDVAPQFFAREFFAVSAQDKFGVDDICFVVPVGTTGTRQLGTVSRSNQLYQLGGLEEGTTNIYRITNVVQIGSEVKVRYAIKQSEKQFLTNRPETCEQVCTKSTTQSSLKDKIKIEGTDKAIDVHPTIQSTKKPNIQKDPNELIGSVCVPAAQCNQWAAEKPEAQFGNQKINIKSAKRQGYTSDCFPPATEFSDVSDNMQARYECCCLNSQSSGAPPVYYLFDDINRYENDKLERETAFKSKAGDGIPANYNEMEWSYRYWKEGYITLAKSLITKTGRSVQHNQYNPNRYIEGRDWAACFGQNNYLYDGGLFSPGPAEGEVGKLLMIDSRQQFESAFFCANIAGIRNRLVMLNNIQTGLARCLVDIRQTGTSDAAACKEFFTRYVCSSIWQTINFAQSLFSDTCTSSPLSLPIEDEDSYAATISDGFRAVTQSINDAQAELSGEYGNAELNNLLGTGSGEIARKVCLAAFGYDWDFSLQNIIDAAYSQSFETLVQKVTGTREYLTIDPTSGQARYEYRSSWVINPGCDLESYKVELACVSRNEFNKEGAFVDPLSSVSKGIIATRGIRCDAVGSPDGNNCDCLNLDREQTKAFFTSRGRLLQNKLVQQRQDEVVSSLYRYDHLKLTLRPDRKISGNLKSTCFPPGHEDGVFYFPLTDKTARDIAACTVEPISGVFQCKGALDFWSQKGLANIVDISINGQKPQDNKFTILRGEPLILTPTIFKTPGSPNKCLVMELERQGVGITSPNVETINVDGLYQYSPITLEENVQPIQNIRNIPPAEFITCTSPTPLQGQQAAAQSGRPCQDIISRQKPTLTVLQRGNFQEFELSITFIDENSDGTIDLRDDSKDEMEVLTGNAPETRRLGKGGWYNEDRKKPVIDKPELNIMLQVNSVPYLTTDVKSVTYRQIVPSASAQTTTTSTGLSTSFASDNVWRLRVRLFNADENTLLCSRYNPGEVVQYQGVKQEKLYTINVAAQSQQADAPRIGISLDKDNIKPSGENSRLTVEVTDETKVGNIIFQVSKPGGPKINWDIISDNVKDLCVLESLQGFGERKICSIEVDGNKLNIDAKDAEDRAGTYRISVTAWDEDKLAHNTVKEIPIEVLCGPSSDNSYGICTQGNRCARESVIDSPISCQQGFECCRRFEG